MHTTDASAPFLVASCVAIAAVLALYWLTTLSRRARARRRMARARRGEHVARSLLASLGFDVIAEQAPGLVVLHVDGEKSVHGVRADYLVERGGRRFVAEVKTGALAPSLDHGPTRRQLLKYASAFPVDGVLLVDADAGLVREVSFGERRPSPRWPAFASGLFAGVVTTSAAVGIVISAWLLR